MGGVWRQFSPACSKQPLRWGHSRLFALELHIHPRMTISLTLSRQPVPLFDCHYREDLFLAANQNFLSCSLCLLVLPPSLCTCGSTIGCLLNVCLPIRQLRTILVSSHVLQSTVESEKTFKLPFCFPIGIVMWKSFASKVLYYLNILIIQIFSSPF